ncbi:MAG: uracil-DNA glycosylase, partial [Gemmobacter sp.]
MDTAYDHELIAALLQWQAELGADEALGEAPVNRYDLPAEAARPAAVAKAERPAPAAPPPATTTAADPVELARSLAEGADDL